MNLSSMLFSCTLVLGTTLSISSESWIMMWIGLEVNLMSFIPMMKMNNTPYESEASMKYFLVQALASSLLMMTILASEVVIMNTTMLHSIMMGALLMKMGAAPFHFWFPAVMQGLSWGGCLLLMTWQKIAPMIMMSYQLKPSIMMNMIVTISVITGAVGGIAQTSIRKMFAYSSISHLGWLIMALMMSNNYWMMYFTMYVVMSAATVTIFSKNEAYYLTQVFNMKTEMGIKMMMFITMLSLGGMPPFTGFVPKWIIIQNMISSQMYMMTFIMVMTTLITLYMYMRLTYSALTFNSQGTQWQNQYPGNILMFISTGATLMGIPLIACMNLT
uniref:NADH-ubiquinone oxidoreductase chain 2 n=1 Tax=Mnais tenuis TaxID=193267 RepID=A0A898CRQ5_9ODON|nr:NADH dehydrogenase subunit 2 [Mnais tenuis]QSH89862.1 NADH dehydrogenase subunit 2 [Mnais tenuis]